MIRRHKQIDKDLVRRRSVFGRRAVMLGGVQAAGLGALGYRYYDLQVRNHEIHKAVATDNRLLKQVLEPKRGRIFDRFGERLAINTSGFQVNFTPQDNGQDSLTLVRLFELARMSEADITAFTDRLVANRTARTVSVLEAIDRETAVAIESELLNLPGVDVVERDTRHYPFGELAAHVVGYVRDADDEDLARDDDDLLRLPGFKVGQTGVEGTMDRTLRGNAGVQENEIDAHGKRLKEVRRILPAQGADLELTIDIGLQQSIVERLRNDPNVEEGAVVVMNIHTGEVLASVSYPTYDPNRFIGRVDPDWFSSINVNPKRPQLNRVMLGRYPPASTYKMLPMLAALESGRFTTQHRVNCQGFIDIETEGGDSSKQFRCWQRRGHGTLTMPSALKFSCDVYLYELVANLNIGLGHEKTIEMAAKFGLGSQNCMDLIGESEGVLPTSDYKLLKHGDGWRLGDTINASIGQGFWLTTPLQLATMTSRLANGGVAVRPYYVQPNVPYSWPRMDVERSNLNRIRDAMTQVTMDERGTAFAARIQESGFEMAGKTGTAQVASLAGGSELAPECNLQSYDTREHSLFVGYAPVDQPKYACAVVIEHGCSGSKTAAPIARDVLTVAQKRSSGALGVSMPSRPTMREITDERVRAEAEQRDREQQLGAANSGQDRLSDVNSVNSINNVNSVNAADLIDPVDAADAPRTTDTDSVSGAF